MGGLLRCTKCGNIDHTDINYANGLHLEGAGKPTQLLCTICLGKPWHNKFPVEKYNKEYHQVVNPPPGDTYIVAPM